MNQNIIFRSCIQRVVSGSENHPVVRPTVERAVAVAAERSVHDVDQGAIQIDKERVVIYNKYNIYSNLYLSAIF